MHGRLNQLESGKSLHMQADIERSVSWQFLFLLAEAAWQSSQIIGYQGEGVSGLYS